MTVAACGEKKEETTASSGSGSSETAGKDCGKVVLNEQAWAGSTANTYIAKNVLEENLGCQVEITKVAEIPAFQAMADGEVDAVLEDWQHTDEYKKYIDQAGTVVDGGPLGVEGHIGWFIPKYLMDEHPEFADWEGLKGEEDLFKTAESGDQGMFLGGDPSYVQKDKELIEALGLNLKHVTAGAEPAQVARWSQLYKQKKPVLFYWYTPQFYNQEYDLAEVKLPERTADCKDDAKTGGDVDQYKCAYDVTVIEKLFSKKFADSGSPAYDVLKNMKLTNDDQEAVAKAIAGDKRVTAGRRALRAGRSGQPFEPRAAGVPEPEHPGRRDAVPDRQAPEHAEHALVARALEEPGRELRPEHARPRVGAHRHQRVERDPVEVAVASEPLDLVAEARLLPRGEEDVDVGVEQARVHVRGEPLDDAGEDLERVAAHRRGGVGGGVVGGQVEARERLRDRRRARAQPRADGRVGDVERLGVDPDADRDGRRRGRQRRRARAAQLGLQRDRRVGRADLERGGAAPIAIAVGVQVQGEARAGADVDERQRPARVGRDGGDRGQQVRAARRLAHLVAVRAGQGEQLVAVGEAERAQLAREVRRERRLPVARRERAGERIGAVALDERHDRGDEQERREAIGVDPGRERQQLRIVAQRGEERRGQRPRGRRPGAGPRRGELLRLRSDRGYAFHFTPHPRARVSGSATGSPARTASSAARSHAASCAGSWWSASGAPR